MPFSQLGLNDRLVRGVRATGFSTPTEIQSRAIPPALAGRDLVGVAQTGTGKTAAYVLPMLQRFSNPNHTRRDVRGLVLTPTRELAQQIEDSITSYGRFTSVSATSIFGGVNMENQIRRLRRGIAIIVATPGRLLDHIARRTVNLSCVEVLVLDEADRMFDMGFINDVRKIVERIPQKRQTLLFSATMPEEIRRLTASIQSNPEVIQIGTPGNPAGTITQHFYAVPQERKLELLAHLIEKESMSSALVFSRTKHGADKICRKLERKGFTATAIHSNRSQAQRQRALAEFKQGTFKVLVATDVAARGIDVEGISHVVNYDTPAFAEDYIHRIGRTGRAEATGDAVTFVSAEERGYFRKIEQMVGKRFELKRYPGFDDAVPHESRHHVAEPKRATDRTKSHTHPHREESREGNREEKRRYSSTDRQSSERALHDFRRGKSRFQRKDNLQRAEHASHTGSERHVAKDDWMGLLTAGNEVQKSITKKIKRMIGRDPR